MTRWTAIRLPAMWLLAALSAYPRMHPSNDLGGAPIPKLVSASALVCAGEVTRVPPLRTAPSIEPLNTPATVHLVRCFKGQPPAANIEVLYDGVLPSAGFAGGALPLILERGDYALFFLKPHGEEFAPVDVNYGVATISRHTASADPSIEEPLLLIERELIAGLNDSSRDLVLANIRLLGLMEELHSPGELKRLANSNDLLTCAYAWEALMRVGDYSNFQQVADFLAAQPKSSEFLMDPAIRIWNMQIRLSTQIEKISDARFLPQLEQWMFSPKLFLKRASIGAVRHIALPDSVPSFLKLLDDPNPDFRFDAAMGLIEIVGGGPDIPIFGWKDFQLNPELTSARVREWWKTSGRYRLHPVFQHEDGW